MQIVVEQFFSKPIELHFKGKQNLGGIFLQVMSVSACVCACGCGCGCVCVFVCGCGCGCAQRRAGERQVPPTRGACVCA